MANQAHTTRPSKFNLSKIMKRAWELYRTCRYELQREYIASGFKLDRFRNCLKSAWVSLAAIPPKLPKRGAFQAGIRSDHICQLQQQRRHCHWYGSTPLVR